MTTRSTANMTGGAIATGIALWLVAGALAGRREAWDGPEYWAVAYPVALVACALLGYRSPDRPWRWAGALFAGQFIGLVLRNGELGNLWPLGIIMFAFLAVPGAAAAWIGARFRTASHGRRE